MCAGDGSSMRRAVSEQNDSFVSKTTDAQRKRLVVCHVHDALRRRRVMRHDLAGMILEEPQTCSRCKDVDDDLCQWFDSGCPFHPDFLRQREVVHSPSASTIGVRIHFSSELLSAKKSHSWRMMKKDLPLRRYSCPDKTVSEGCSQYTGD